MQAAIGCAQLEKLPSFIEAEKEKLEASEGRAGSFVDKLVLPRAHSRL